MPQTSKPPFPPVESTRYHWLSRQIHPFGSGTNCAPSVVDSPPCHVIIVPTWNHLWYVAYMLVPNWATCYLLGAFAATRVGAPPPAWSAGVAGRKSITPMGNILLPSNSSMAR